MIVEQYECLVAVLLLRDGNRLRDMTKKQHQKHLAKTPSTRAIPPRWTLNRHHDQWRPMAFALAPAPFLCKAHCTATVPCPAVCNLIVQLTAMSPLASRKSNSRHRWLPDPRRCLSDGSRARHRGGALAGFDFDDAATSIRRSCSCLSRPEPRHPLRRHLHSCQQRRIASHRSSRASLRIARADCLQAAEITACQVTAGLPGASSSLDAAPCVLTARMRHLQVLIDAVAKY